MSTTCALHKFRCRSHPASLIVGDILTTVDGDSRWEVVERLTVVQIFVLKNRVSGLKITVRGRISAKGRYYLAEMKNPDGLYREYNRTYYHTVRKPQEAAKKRVAVAA